MNLFHLCLLGFHDTDVVLNLKTNLRIKICKRCKKILDIDRKPNPCGCGKCIALDLNWNAKLIKDGKVIEI